MRINNSQRRWTSLETQNEMIKNTKVFYKMSANIFMKNCLRKPYYDNAFQI